MAHKDVSIKTLSKFLVRFRTRNLLFKLTHNMLGASSTLPKTTRYDSDHAASVAGNGTHDGIPVRDAEGCLVRFKDGILF